MNTPTPDGLDGQDMSRLTAGHDAALNSLMERHAMKLFNYLVRCLQNEDDAADAAQETFMRVYQSRVRFAPPPIVFNLALRHRIQSRERPLPLAFTASANFAGCGERRDR